MSSQSPGSGLGRFVAELRRRHVVRVAVAYGAVGFVLLQAAEIVLPAFLPGFEADAALRVVVVGFLVLFPVVVALAWVYEITPQGIRAMEAIDAEAGRAPGGRILPRVALLVFTILAAGSAGLWWYRTDSAALDALEARRAERQTPFVRATTTDASGPIRSLAVLPLQDFSPGGDDSQAYFAAGMHEALISQLSQLGTVRVISRTSTEGYRRAGKSLPQIGADLGVDAVVEGSVLRADGKVRITVQLVHAASDTHLWARDYERELEDVIALQREVAVAIAGEIESRLEGATPAEAVPADAAVTVADAAGAAPDPDAGEVDAPAGEAATGVSTPAAATDAPGQATPPLPSRPAAPEVQDAVLRGRFALRDETGDRAAQAERYFQEALARDSTFVPALTGLAGAHLLRGLEGADAAALDELLAAHRVAVRAVSRDSTSVEAREVLASTEEALAEVGVRLARLSPESSGSVRVVRLGADSVMFIAAGDTARFVAGATPTASATEMGQLIQVALAGEHTRAESVGDELRSLMRFEVGGRYEEAAARAREALTRYPEEPVVWDAAERLAVVTGDLEGAVELRSRREESVPSPGPDARALALGIEEAGVEGYWRWKLEELDAREAAGLRVSPVDRAAVWSALGQPDRALDLLEEARERRDPRLVSLRTDPVWDPLRPESRFKALLSAMGPGSRRSRPGGNH